MQARGEGRRHLLPRTGQRGPRGGILLSWRKVGGLREGGAKKGSLRWPCISAGRVLQPGVRGLYKGQCVCSCTCKSAQASLGEGSWISLRGRERPRLSIWKALCLIHALLK